MESIAKSRWTGARAGGALLLLLLALALLFNGMRGLWAPDEGRYVAAALEMLRRHDILGIYLNDDTAHFTKPPLTYWALAGAFAVFGKSEFVARLPNALAFVATALLLLPAGRLLTPRMPALPPALYATMLLPFLAAGAITTDTLVALWTTLGGVAFLHYQMDQRPRAAAIVVWFAFGLAFLTKGPPALLSLIAFIGWLAAHRDWSRLRGLVISWGVPLFAIVGLGWYLLAVTRYPGLLDYFLHRELADRVATGTFHRNAHWYGAIAVYLPTLLLGTLPWLPAWIVVGRRMGGARAWHAGIDRLLLTWIGVPLLVHAFAASRLPLYLLPIFPPLALWLARRVEPVAVRMDGRRRAILIAGWCVILLAARLVAGGLSPVDRDGRAAAARLQAAVPARIVEITYVDLKPWWEMRFYLDAQVHEAWVERVPHDPAYEMPRPLSEVLGRRAHEQSVFAVRRTSIHDFERLLRRSGFCAQRLGQDGLAVFYRASSAAGGAVPSGAAPVPARDCMRRL